MNIHTTGGGCGRLEASVGPGQDSARKFRLEACQAKWASVCPLKLLEVNTDNDATRGSPPLGGIARSNPHWPALRFAILPNDLKSRIRAAREQNRPSGRAVVKTYYRPRHDVSCPEAHSQVGRGGIRGKCSTREFQRVGLRRHRGSGVDTTYNQQESGCQSW